MKPTELARKFETQFHTRPRIFRAPGRVNLIGEHTDYNDGFVLPAAIGFSTYVAVGTRSNSHLTIHSEQFPGNFDFDLSHLPQQRTGSWCDYILGVANIFQQHGLKLRGMNLLVNGEVPVGAGLSSSAAMEVASAFALLSQIDVELPLSRIAQLCRQAENSFVGARVGIMDPFVSCVGQAGHAILLDCRTLDFEATPIPSGIRLVVCNTMVKHDLATGTYNTRRAECEEAVRCFAQFESGIHALRDVSLELLEQHAADLDPTILKRCSHVVHENERTVQTAQALRSGDLARVGQLMHDSHVSLRDLYEVSSRELDIMVESAQSLPGFVAGRMTGGGFGGCTVNLVEAQNVSTFVEEIAGRYQRATGITPQIYICPTEAGAQEITGEF
jgi:galactokinase